MFDEMSKDGLENVFEVEAVLKLNKDLKQAAKVLTRSEARYMVDGYYTVQEYRKAMGNQMRSMEESGEPNAMVSWLYNNVETLERNIKNALEVYAITDPVGHWAMSIPGIGPVISAGLLAHIDIEKAPTVGHIWSFAGLNPDAEWVGSKEATDIVHDAMEGAKELTEDHIIRVASRLGQNPEALKARATTEEGDITVKSLISASSKRPWNADLKVLCWKIGESFVKVSNRPNDVYGKIYKIRREYENQKNENFEYASQAKAKLERFNIGKSTEAYKWYSIGKLPPAHIMERSKRYATKIFLAHWHEAAYRVVMGQEPPMPYALAILNHAHKIEMPNKHLVPIAGK